jgi:(2Fe-2S) ferredoxin
MQSSYYIRANSLTLFDRCYQSAELLINWQRQQPEAHWLHSLKGNTKYRIVETFGNGDHLVEMLVSHRRENRMALCQSTGRSD